MSGLASAPRTAGAFRALHRRILFHHFQEHLLRGGRLRLLMIVACSLIFWTGLFVLFFEGFRFLGTFVKLSNEIVEALFGTFFLSLLVMLIFSAGIILHTGLFASREAAFLLATPAADDRVFAHKFAEAMAFSSWGFMLLGSPMLVAYGLSAGAPWPYYALFLGFLVAFVLIPGSIGGIGAILVACLLPRRRKTILGLALVGLLAALGILVMRMVRTPGDILSRNWLDSLVSQLGFSQHPLLPSRWMSRGLIEAARGQWRTGLFYLGVTAANAGLVYLIASVVARDLYRLGYSRVQGGRSARRRSSSTLLDRGFHRLFGFVPRPVRLLILKDIRTFFRDPAQWSQFLIFFGLLALYFVNIRRLGYDDQNTAFRYLLSFLNLAVTALLLSTFTSRFIFPLLSLEGRNFWILGLLPLERSQILWGKFAFSAGIALVATEGLILLSDAMLRVGPMLTAIHVLMVAILCLGLSAISVGLGARMPNLKEDDPSRIAAGFGGTLNLLVSLVFILVEIGVLAVPCLIFLAGQEVNGAGISVPSLDRLRFWLVVAMIAGVVIGAAATVIPLRIGIRAFQRIEF